MNDSTLTELKIIVERCVRPVRATMARKRKMREELLAHLVSIFEEEAEKLGDEQAAVDRARLRFGDPSELSAELQRTVPRLDRLISLFDTVWTLKPGESLLHFVGRQSVFMGVSYTLLPLVLLPILIARGKQVDYATACYGLLVSCLAMVALSLPVVFWSTAIGRSLYGRESERSMKKAALYCLASLVIFPAFSFLTYGLLTWDLAASLAHLRFGCCFALAGPVVLVMMSRQMLEDHRYREEWASLELGQ